MSSRQINFRCPEAYAKVFEDAARAADVSLTQWFILLGLTATGDAELLAQLQRVKRRRRRR